MTIYAECDLFVQRGYKGLLEVIQSFPFFLHFSNVTSFPPDHSWQTAMEIINKKNRTFNPRAYIKKGYIRTHFDETIPWDEIDEILYEYFRGITTLIPYPPTIPTFSCSRLTMRISLLIYSPSCHGESKRKRLKKKKTSVFHV